MRIHKKSENGKVDLEVNVVSEETEETPEEKKKSKMFNVIYWSFFALVIAVDIIKTWMVTPTHESVFCIMTGIFMVLWTLMLIVCDVSIISKGKMSINKILLLAFLNIVFLYILACEFMKVWVIING